MVLVFRRFLSDKKEFQKRSLRKGLRSNRLAEYGTQKHYAFRVQSLGLHDGGVFRTA